MNEFQPPVHAVKGFLDLNYKGANKFANIPVVQWRQVVTKFRHHCKNFKDEAKQRHACPEWDFDFIDNTMPEFTACMCYGEK